MPLGEDWRGHWLLTRRLYLDMVGSLSGARGDWPLSPSSTLLFRRVLASFIPRDLRPLTNLIIGHEGWTWRRDFAVSVFVHDLKKRCSI